MLRRRTSLHGGAPAHTKIFGIHPLTVEDIVTGADREKCEQYDNYTFIVTRGLVNDAAYVPARRGRLSGWTSDKQLLRGRVRQAHTLAEWLEARPSPPPPRGAHGGSQGL